MKAIYKLLLWLCTAALPVVIAACYGVPYGYGGKSGRVVDAETGEGITDIQITCPYSPDAYTENEYIGVTNEEGTFFTGDCNPMLFQDVDGELSGGFYHQKLERAAYDDQEMVVELVRAESHIAGQVISSEDEIGIGGIEVRCLDQDGATLSAATTLQDGRFFVGYEDPCHTLQFEDVDREKNGSFVARDVEFDPDSSDDLVVQLDPTSE